MTECPGDVVTPRAKGSGWRRCVNTSASPDHDLYWRQEMARGKRTPKSATRTAVRWELRSRFDRLGHHRAHHSDYPRGLPISDRRVPTRVRQAARAFERHEREARARLCA